jgi:hypothetical protein
MQKWALVWGRVLHFDATNGVVVRLWRPEPLRGHLMLFAL